MNTLDHETRAEFEAADLASEAWGMCEQCGAASNGWLLCADCADDDEAYHFSQKDATQ